MIIDVDNGAMSKTKRTITVQAKDAATGQPLVADVKINGVSGKSWKPLTYSVPCKPAIDAQGKPINDSEHACKGRVSKSGYETAIFEP